ncbi:neurogenic locus notch homolog protein 3-like isoform X2 [Bacillus rossius redtenbacheri]|uniref:neurogenic locus notch homolog protein 3-like isoform X2 n=1 Tax=Bacillus rossius redtenbacheri TaxID=93214 RepID=UPI002FDF00D6
MRRFRTCVFLLFFAVSEAVYDYRGADNRVVDASASSSTRYHHQPWPPPTERTDAEEANYIDRTPQRYLPALHRQGSSRRSTAGLYRTWQRGSVHIPYRGAVLPVPVASGRSQLYRGTITTTVIASGESNESQNSVGLPARDSPAAGDVCVRCPADKVVVARKGSDHVLMQRSRLRRCRRRPKVPGAKFEILYGPRSGSALAEGVHTVTGRAVYKHTQLFQCQYSYTVIVRRCAPLTPPAPLEARCSQDTAWGSVCRLYCRQDQRLSGPDQAECGDDLKWTAPLPVCRAETGCALPMSPDNGRLSCQAGPGASGASGADQLPEGSTCRYECDQGFAVPAAQAHLVVTSCAAGQWNSSADASCLPLAEARHPADDSSEIAAFQSDSIHHVVRLRHRRYRHPVTKSPAADACTPSPCQGGGTCLTGPSHAPVLCLCPDHKEGQFCEREICSKDICKNGGKCLMYGTETTCFCRQGYAGRYCEILELG